MRGLIFRWSKEGVIGNIRVTEPSPANPVAFSIDDCSPRLQAILNAVDVPPAQQIPVTFTLVPFGGEITATSVDGPA